MANQLAQATQFYIIFLLPVIICQTQSDINWKSTSLHLQSWYFDGLVICELADFLAFFSIWKTILFYCESASDKAVAIRLFQVFLAFELVKILGYNGKLLTFFPWDAFFMGKCIIKPFYRSFSFYNGISIDGQKSRDMKKTLYTTRKLTRFFLIQVCPCETQTLFFLYV